ncbi:TetR/AcrR family transcriptional regulator [Arvimicrobium flavum]|uniref:TetR/AcrR family transcriptional regulator n=1 Tax=Arvimicrobium flavum TaxID=3393320 RepID=UPI003084450D
MPQAEAGSAKAKSRVRDAEATKQRILAAAKREFARNGLAGARVDLIAEKAKANKRMIYHYFESKENLFLVVVENAYIDIRTAEQQLRLDDLPPAEALERLVRFTWNYYLKNPEFITLVNSENLHRAKHLKRSELVQDASRRMVAMVAGILERGVAAGVFRAGVDPVQLNISIAAIGYFYLTNRYTGAILYERDMMTPEALDERLGFNIDTILRMVAA